jgi:metal-dependent hydrolase (beta-lactamase superfamily II)
MELTSTALLDSQAGRGDRLLAEHGVCLLAGMRGREALLDAGKSDACLRSAARLNAP